MARIPQDNAPRSENEQQAPPSFQPMRSRSQRSSSSAQGSATRNSERGSHTDSITPPSFSPTAPRRSAQGSTSRARSAQESVQYSRPQYRSSQYPSSRPSLSPRNPQDVVPRRTKKIRFSRIIAMLIVSLLALGIVIGCWSWFWVDGQLNRSIDLSPAPDNSTANTWLVLGSDARDGEVASQDASSVTGFRTDTILVLTKPRSGPASLISIPRDSYVEVNGIGMKINSVAQNDGYDALVSSVENITGTKIDHVVQIGFDGIAHVVDALGGVDLCYDNTVNDEYSGLQWTAGCHSADGTTALAFSRMRYSDPEGDIGRAKRQRQVIAAVMKKAASASTLTNPSKALNVASTTLKALKVDNKTDTATMLSMALAFKAATGSKGVNGSVYYDDINYQPGGVGSAIHLVAQKNSELFSSLNSGSISSGTTVGGLVSE
ncbi:LCP family protein [Alloscardovia omnicolens]|nr:LCP family protein [Alloscardovia omnicolens]MDK6522531.1 LCP family protein [Alloscardovia omnicolens]MDK6643244.1 LCP family protein [Alloscardovia omnicolens]MDK8072954.1 LCP family protein [Alloscardovia omnicolens]MDU6533037.1 LCP family protein [Alloscardovia omnicolens]PKZ16134.1 LytR family transcriptional regulator [Alloscardovia omnicolens]